MLDFILIFLTGFFSAELIFIMIFHEPKNKYVVVYHNGYQKNQIRIQTIKAVNKDAAFEKFYKKHSNECRVLRITRLNEFGLEIDEVYDKYEKTN